MKCPHTQAGPFADRNRMRRPHEVRFLMAAKRQGAPSPNQRVAGSSWYAHHAVFRNQQRGASKQEGRLLRPFPAILSAGFRSLAAVIVLDAHLARLVSSGRNPVPGSGLTASRARLSPRSIVLRLRTEWARWAHSDKSNPRRHLADRNLPSLQILLTICLWRLNRWLQEEVASCSTYRRGISSLPRPLRRHSDTFL